MIGMSRPASSFLIWLAVWKPSMTGICTSRRITSMRGFFCTVASASGPPSANSIWYSSASRASSASWFARRSSTTRMVGLSAMGAISASAVPAPMVPVVWIEQTTYCLQGGCSTTELNGRSGEDFLRLAQDLQARLLDAPEGRLAARGLLRIRRGGRGQRRRGFWRDSIFRFGPRLHARLGTVDVERHPVAGLAGVERVHIGHGHRDLARHAAETRGKLDQLVAHLQLVHRGRADVERDLAVLDVLGGNLRPRIDL